MKTIFLNTYEGTQEKQIRDFLIKENELTDVFCFQEADKKMQGICDEILIDYLKIMKTKLAQKGQVFNNVTYIKNSIEIFESNVILEKNKKTGLGLHTKVKVNDEILNIINCHGIPYPGDKLDTKARIIQSNEILNFAKNIDEPIIIGGDFNLDPTTKSVKLFEENNFLNLIKEFEIKTTRNEVSWVKYPDKQYFADYVFIKKIEVKKFKVPNSDISDHLAMILEI
jgi:endonuclease/exonuclease/phosphatase (EEP) superfamily protein YafD